MKSISIMKKLTFLLFLLPLVSFAQNKGDRAYIIDPGKIMRSYTFTEADEKFFKKTADFKDEIPAIKATYKPAAWPRNIQATKGFNDNKEQIKKFVGYYVGKLPFGQVIVRIPADENDEMPELMRPSKTIYFVMEPEGVVFEEPEPVTK